MTTPDEQGWIHQLFKAPDEELDQHRPPRAGNVVPNEGGNPPAGDPDPMREFTRELFGHTD